MNETQPGKVYDLEERTLQFAKRVRAFVKCIPKTVANLEDGKQIIRSSGSVGANYIEANESLGKKDFLMRIRISRKEAKETKFWAELIYVNSNEIEVERQAIVKEAQELNNIFSSIMRKSVNKVPEEKV